MTRSAADLLALAATIKAQLDELETTYPDPENRHPAIAREHAYLTERHATAQDAAEAQARAEAEAQARAEAEAQAQAEPITN